MKPNQLKSPFLIREERHTAVHDRVWYVPAIPTQQETFIFSGWSDPLFFGNHHPVNIEYCSGNGAWIVEKAKANPSLNWVAVEKKFMRVRKIWSKMKNYGLNNLMILCGEGLFATKKYIPTGTVASVYVNFPDPWPKKRHAKHRIIQQDFVNEMGRIILPSGEFTLATDDVNYSQQMIEVINASQDFVSEYPSPYYITDYKDYGVSWFETLWRSEGRNIHFHKFKKVRDATSS